VVASVACEELEENVFALAVVAFPALAPSNEVLVIQVG